MRGRNCTAWQRQKAGAKGGGSECALWEPEPETSLMTSLHWRVSCPLPEGQWSLRLTKHQEPFAELCQAKVKAAEVMQLWSAPPQGSRREGSLPAMGRGG